VNFRPLGDRLLVKLEPEKKPSGLIVQLGPQPVRTAKVVRVGPGKSWAPPTGGKMVFWETQVKPGERVAFFKAAVDTAQGQAVTDILGEDYALISETDVLFIVEDEVEVSV